MIITNQDLEGKDIGDETSRKVLVVGEKIMLVEFQFAKGSIGIPHSHEEHEQIGYVAKGSFEITVGNETKIAKQGDSYYAAKNVLHGVVSLEDDSVLVDLFTPIRQDLLIVDDK